MFLDITEMQYLHLAVHPVKTYYLPAAVHGGTYVSVSSIEQCI